VFYGVDDLQVGSVCQFKGRQRERRGNMCGGRAGRHSACCELCALLGDCMPSLTA
jgi:hypothetical protein